MISERRGASSLHITFFTQEEWALAGKLGFLQRIGQQFHWRNRGYASFEDFLAALSSRKRKAHPRKSVSRRSTPASRSNG